MCAHVQCDVGCTSHLYQSLFDRNGGGVGICVVGGALLGGTGVCVGGVMGESFACGELCGGVRCSGNCVGELGYVLGGGGRNCVGGAGGMCGVSCVG